MADDLGFEISADVSQALDEIYKMSGAFDNLASVWDKTVRSVGQNNISTVISQQAEQARQSLNGLGTTDIDAKFLKLQDSVNRASTGFQTQAAKVVILKKELSDLQDKLAGIALNEGEDSQAYEQTSVSIAKKQLALNSAEQAVNSYAAKLEIARKSLSDYSLELQRATEEQEKQAAASRSIDTSKAFTDAPKTLFKGKFAGLAEEFGAFKAVTSTLYNTADAEQEVAKQADNASSSMRSFSGSAREATTAVKKNDSFFAQLSRSIKNITFYRLVRGAIKTVMNAAVQASEAMAIWSQQFDTGATGAMASYNDNVSSIASNMLFMRNAIMAAAEPIISALTPAFNMLASAIANAFNMLSQFLSALTGRSFYNKAIKNNVNYANSLKSGSKAQKAFLAGFDELEVVQSQSGGSGAGSTMGIDPGSMWTQEEVSAGMKNLTEPFRAAMDNLRAIWDEHAEGLKAAAGNLWQSIGNLAGAIDTSFWEDFFGPGRIGALLFADALEFLENVMQDLSILIDTIITPFVDGFLKGFSDVAGFIYQVLAPSIKKVLGFFNGFFTVLDDHSGTVSTISEALGYLAGSLTAIAAAVFLAKNGIKLFGDMCAFISANPIVGIIIIITQLIAIFATLYDTNEDFRNFVDGVVQGAVEMIQGFIEGVQGMWNTLKQAWYDFWDGVLNLFKQELGIHSPSTVFKGFGQNVIDGFVNGIRAFFGKIGSVIGDIKKKCDLSSLVKSALQWGKDMMKGFADGISRAKDAVGNAIHTVADKITSLLHFSRPDEGPLRSYEQWMPDFMRGLANGIDNNSNLVYAATGRLAAGMQSALSVPALGIGNVNGSVSLDASSVGEAQMNANQAMADVFWQGCMAVVQAINNKDMSVSIGDDTIGRAASRYERKQSVINGGAY